MYYSWWKITFLLIFAEFIKNTTLLFRKKERKVKKERKSVNGSTYQAYEDAEKLNYISVGHWVETTHKRVQSDDQCRDDDRNLHVDVNDYADGGSWRKQTGECCDQVLKWIPLSVQGYIEWSVTAGISPCHVKCIIQ